MNVKEVVQHLHLDLKESDDWIKKNLNETGTVIVVIHYEKNRIVKTIKNDDYVDPEVMSFTMNVAKYRTKK